MEIERKYLIDESKIDFDKLIGTKIKQGYLLNSKEKVVRIRIEGQMAYITIKGENKGISRPEFEYRIPHEDAEEMLEMCSNVISKTRYLKRYKQDENLMWEIDVFYGDNAGLIIAELEIPNEDYKIKLPNWITKEVDDVKYAIFEFNAPLIDKHGLSECLRSGLIYIMSEFGGSEDYLYDGNKNFGLDKIKTEVKADAKYPEVSAASIIAKHYKNVDSLKINELYPEYSFDKHSGYVTKLHKEKIKEFGYCDAHRKSYKLNLGD